MIIKNNNGMNTASQQPSIGIEEEKDCIRDKKEESGIPMAKGKCNQAKRKAHIMKTSAENAIKNPSTAGAASALAVPAVSGIGLV